MNHTNRATLASRVMGRTGIVVLAFLIYHLMDFTLRVQHPEWGRHIFRLADGTMVRDVHEMMVQGFSRAGVSIFYIIAVGLLAYHLSHGARQYGANPRLEKREMDPGARALFRRLLLALFSPQRRHPAVRAGRIREIVRLIPSPWPN